jgi:DNA-binding CsgD family transcriptional regulator
MDRTIVGRDPERDVIRAFLDGLAAGTGGELVLAGPAGMGKTVLWEEAVAAAGRSGLRVLDSRPTHADSGLAFAGLHELLRAVTAAELAVLPAPQRRALDAALYREDATGEPVGLPEADGDPAPEAGAIAVALLTLLRSLAGFGPLLVAVDDIQWLDPSSRAPLRFALRRLRTAPVAALVALRVDEPGGQDDAWPTDDPSERIDLRPLSLGALHRVLVDRFGLSFGRPGLVRLLELTGGNPFLATELVGAWGSEAAVRAASGQPLPETVARLVRRRVAGLGVDERRIAQVVALLGRAREDLLARVLQGDAGAAALREAAQHAMDAGVLQADGERIRCAHPLIASALATSLSPASARELHARIAAELDDPIEAAPHLAAAAAGPDGAVAERLDRAAEIASQRGATLEAAGLREQALGLTPSTDAAGLARRRFELADALFTAGDTGAARDHLRQVPLDDPHVDAPTRREALLLRATIAWFDGDQPASVALAERALAESPEDARWQAKANARLSWVIDDDLPRQAAYAAAALRLLDPARDPVTYAFAALNGAWARLLAGEGADDDAVALGDRLQEAARSWEYSTVPAAWAKAMDRFDEARSLIERYLQHSRERGDESSVAQLLSMQVEVEAWTGRLAVAMSLADASVAEAQQSGQEVYLAISLARRAQVHAYRGDLDAAEADARAALAIAVPPLTPPVALAALGFVALTARRPAAAVEHLATADAMLDGVGMRDPAAYRFHGDLVEALVRTGDLGEAVRQTARLEQRARVAPRPWVEAVAARSRGLVLAGGGDVAGALDAVERALEAHRSLDMPFELARTRLVQGVALRRAGSRRRASEALVAAAEGFEALGCGPWAERARDELARVGLRPRDDGGLSPSEQRIARLAADGLTNRVIADRLVISPKTVEATLARVYLKLGIGSRAELGAHMAGLATSAAPTRDAADGRRARSGASRSGT